MVKDLPGPGGQASGSVPPVRHHPPVPLIQLTPRELNRATLARQLLLERRPLSVPDGVRQVVALQAQHPASPYVALWNRARVIPPPCTAPW
ncbi:hypothetical protein B9W68_17460 [Streptomyces sp. CS227]|nr:hypothetical protein B9W68_17460 [Streptomyces sp. CS227]